MFVNDNICFIEKSNANLQNTNIDGSTESEKISYRKNNFPPVNIVVNKNMYVSLKPGAFSSLDSMNLIVNDFYKKDSRVKNNGTYTPYSDQIRTANNIEVLDNPIIFKNNIGNNPPEDFDDLFTYAFYDTEEVTNFRQPKYIQYMNAFNIYKLSQSISVLGVYEESSGTNIKEISFKGISSNISSTDARGRSVHITDAYNVNDNMQEGFLDQEIENNVENSGLIKRNFKYSVVDVNGVETVILETGQENFSFIEGLTKSILYYNEENMIVDPFNDTQSESEMLESIITTARGVDSDNLTSQTVTIGSLGEMD